MSKFQYIATDKTGKATKGTVEADNQEAAVELVRKQGLRLLSIRTSAKGGSLNISIGGKVKIKDLVIFTRQLATLVNAGVPLVKSLSTLQQQTESAKLKTELEISIKKIEAGSSLGDALSEHKKIGIENKYIRILI